MSFYISICEDMVAFRATGLIDKDSLPRGMIGGRSGNHICYSNDGLKSMIVITSIDGLAAISALSYITVTTPEALFGYTSLVPDETTGELTEVDVAADTVLRALYDSIYDQSPVTDEFGNTHTPSRYFALPGGYDTSHLL